MKDEKGYMRALKCRECGREYPLAATHVCEFDFGPLEVVYVDPKGDASQALQLATQLAQQDNVDVLSGGIFSPECLGVQGLAAKLQEHVKSVTAPYKYPRVVDFAAELPKTASGKVRRAALRDGC